MLDQILLALLLTVLTTVMHGCCSAVILRFLAVIHAAHWAVRSLFAKVASVSLLVLVMLTVMLFEAALWSLTYRAIGALEHAQEALYFSIVTFTTL